jgi:hypothetical protein
MNFILLFVQTRGNLSEVEKALGVSYPTIRGKLEEIIRIVTATPAPAAQPEQPPAPTAPDDARRREVLARIAAGQLSTAEGLATLRAAGGARRA